MDLRQEKLIIVDLETTGGNAYNQRIIEMGMIRVERGKVVDTFSTLVDPQRPIPPTITSLTGITDRDVAGAPTFSDVRDKVAGLLKDCLFVAHNVRFDYGFLKRELENAGTPFSAPYLCTVCLSRLLFKDQRRHDLGSIIKRFRIACPQRHRALSDANAVWEFLQILYQTLDTDRIQGAVEKLTKAPTFPAHLNADKVHSLPESNGAYILYDQNGGPLYVGKSQDIRRHVLSHFSKDQSSDRRKAICQQTADVEARQTSGPLGALLLELNLIKTLAPAYNRRARAVPHLTAIKWSVDRDEFLQLYLQPVGRLSAGGLSDIYALFRSRREAKKILDEMAQGQKECRPLSGQELGREYGFCFQVNPYRQARRGLCPVINLNYRTRSALERYRIMPWPFDAPVMIKEEDVLRRCGEVFVVDRWSLVDSIRFDEYGQGPFLDGSDAFDPELYKILHTYISKNPQHITVLSDKDEERLGGSHDGRAGRGGKI